MVSEDQMQTLHLFVVPENKLPPKPDYVGIVIASLCSLVLVGIIGLVLFSPKTEPTVSYAVTINGFRLPSVSKTIKLRVLATGKGHTDATNAHGTITFYNGQTYTQIIPIGTVLTGSDGTAVVTDSQAVIPPAAQTTPPTYGRVGVPAHALHAGRSGNIQAGDINEACCVTSVIAQNPYSFIGGKNAQDFTYLTSHDVSYAVSETVQRLELQTQALFTVPIVLAPTCTTSSKATPAIGSMTNRAVIALTSICRAISYSVPLAKNQIVAACKGCGQVSHIQYAIVRIEERKEGIRLHLYVTAVIRPIVHLRFRK